MITRHDDEGRVLFASLAAQTLFGEPAQKILGDGLFERVHVADRPAYLTALSRSLANNEAIAVEFRVRRARAIHRALCVGRDALPADAARRERRARARRHRRRSPATSPIARRRKPSCSRTRDEAESASRAKTQFLANMSHELRTPLNAVIGFSEILNRELFGALGEARYRDYARLIHESGEHLLNVVNDILDMSKIEAGKFKIVKEPFDVAPAGQVVLRYHAAHRRAALAVADRGCGAGHARASGRQARLQADAAQRDLERHQVHRSRRLGARLGAAWSARMSNLASPITASASPRRICRSSAIPSCRPTIPTTGAMTAPGLGLSVVKGLARLHGGSASS